MKKRVYNYSVKIYIGQVNNMKTYNAGIDIGSTTVKLVVLDETDKIIYGEYRRHCAHTQSTLAELVGSHNTRQSFEYSVCSGGCGGGIGT